MWRWVRYGNDKVRDLHCHITGKFRWAAHNECNINYRIPEFIHVLFHNLQTIRRLCSRLLVVILNCWRVNESWKIVITEFLIQTLGAVFATKSLLELGSNESDNLNFINFKIDIFKIRRNSWILGTLKFIKFEFSIYALDSIFRFSFIF